MRADIHVGPEQNALQAEAGYIDARPLTARSSKSSCYARPDQCSEASCHSSGWKSRQQRSPDTVVVISSDGEGDRSVESLEVKAPVGWETGQIRTGGASNLTGRSSCEPA